jgi:hypothetical protein
MSTLSTAQRNAGRDAMNGLFEVGTGDAYLRIEDSSNNVLVEVALNETTVMGATAAGVSTMNAAKAGAWSGLSVAPSLAGTADHAVVTNRNGVSEEVLTVGVGSGEVQLGNLSIQTGVNVVFSAAPYVTQAAS